MINQNLIDQTAVGKVAKRVNIKLNGYYLFLLVLNLLAASLVVWDAKGIVVLFFTLGFSLVVRLMLTQREEQRITNELLEELIEANSGIKPLR